MDDNDVFVYPATTSKDVSSLISLKMYKVDELIQEELQGELYLFIHIEAHGVIFSCLVRKSFGVS